MQSSLQTMTQSNLNTKINSTGFYILKYLLLFFIVGNIVGNIWVGIYNKIKVEEAKRLYPDDRWTGDAYHGRAAEIWEKLCIVYLVLTSILCLMGIIGAIFENYCVLQIYGIISFASAIYGAGGGYIKGSVCSYLLPFIVGILSISLSHQIKIRSCLRCDKKVKTRTTSITRSASLLLKKNSIYESSNYRPLPKHQDNNSISNTSTTSSTIKFNGVSMCTYV